MQIYEPLNMDKDAELQILDTFWGIIFLTKGAKGRKLILAHWGRKPRGQDRESGYTAFSLTAESKCTLVLSSLTVTILAVQNPCPGNDVTCK